MKKLLGHLLNTAIVLIAGYFLLAASSPVLAYTQTGCTVGNYVCTGTVGASTCVINASGYGGVWQPSAPTENQAQNSSNCSTAQQFISAGTWFVQPPDVWQQQTFGTDPEQVDGNKYGVFMAQNLANTIIAAIGGVETEVQTPTGMQKQRNGGAIGLLADLTGALYTTPPASSVEYLADLGNTLGLVKPAYAQGVGFSGFSSVLTLWKTFRDITYLAFVIIFVIVGMMVMFRRKIDPRTVVTIQEALPRVVVALLLITFSYAIAGLLIDAGELLTKMTGSILQEKFIATTGDPRLTMEKLYKSNIFELAGPLADTSHLTEKMSKSKIIDWGPLGDLTMGLVFSLASIFVMFKIFFALLGPYVSIVLSVIFAPFAIILTSLPGSSYTISSWVKGLVSKILVFPVTFLMLAIAYVIKGGAVKTNGVFGGVNWDVVSGGIQINWAPVTMGTGDWGNVVGDLLAFGILFAIPNVAEMIQHAFEIKPSPFGAAPTQELKGAVGHIPIVGGLLGGAMK